MALIEDFGLFEPMRRDGEINTRAERAIVNRIQTRLYRHRKRFGKNLLEYMDSGCDVERATHFALLDSGLTKVAAYRYDVYIDSLVQKTGGPTLFSDKLRHELDTLSETGRRATVATALAALQVAVLFAIGARYGLDLPYGFGLLVLLAVTAIAIIPVYGAIGHVRIRDAIQLDYAGPRKLDKEDHRIVKALTLKTVADRYYHWREN